MKKDIFKTLELVDVMVGITLQVYSSAPLRPIAERSCCRDGMQPHRCSIALIVLIHSS